MGEARLKVELLDMTDNAISVIYVASRQCYSPKFAGDLFKEKKSKKEKEEFIRNLVKAGHESPLEHVKFTFAVEGVSRILTHQLVRHRIASYSQQSQRYVKEDFDYIIPPSIKRDKEAKQEFIRIMEESKKAYNFLVERLKRENKTKTREEVYQDARFILPQAVETKIVVTMNCRELLHFFKQRCCMRAQWEIRTLAWKMLKICKKKLPAVFENAGPKCVFLGYCPEGKFSCGKYPLKEEIVR